MAQLCPKFKVHALLLRSSAGGTQKYEYSMNTWIETWWTVEAKSLAVAHFFSFRLYMWCALNTFTGKFMQREWVFADLPILHNICCFLWFAGYQLLGQILMDGDLFLLTFESWWVDITFALWHGENAPCYFHHDMVHTAAIVTKLLLYELFVVCLFFVFFSMVNPYKVSWQTGRSQDLDQESMPINFKLQ